MSDPLPMAVPARYPDLAGRVAIVTGGSKGIGKATCRFLADNGCKVAVVARNKPEIDSFVAELRAGGAEAIGLVADCTDAGAVSSMVAEVHAELGPTDVLMAFAGGFGAKTTVLDITEAEWHRIIESNLTSTFLTVQAVLPSMIERRHGSIVTMASNGARLLDIPLTASYAAAKAGIVMFTRHVAIEMGPHNVRLNVVAPAMTLSERVEVLLSASDIASIGGSRRCGRIGYPEDTAGGRALFPRLRRVVVADPASPSTSRAVA